MAFRASHLNPRAKVRRYRRAEAARYLQEHWGIPCSPRTLAKIACVSSEGPEMEYVGRIPLYPEDALDAYARRKLSPRVRSTSEMRDGA